MSETHASPAGSGPFQSNGVPTPARFSPDRFVYDMVQWMFLPWTMIEDAARAFAAQACPVEKRP